MNNKHLSKYLSLILRHQPQKLGIQLDKNGWANLEELILAMKEKGMNVDLLQIEDVVLSNNKQRFKLDLQNNRIRANQGHSVPIKLDLEAVEPPLYLFHGTALKNLSNIKQKGLLRGERNHVHLSSDEQTAIQVGARHGKPVVLKIKALEMANQNISFFLSENKVWLTKYVGPDFIDNI